MRKQLTTIFFGLFITCLYLPKDFFDILNKEIYLGFEDYVSYYKYPVQRHEVITPDGYILTVFRIQAKNQFNFKSNLPVVYLQHGLFDSSDSYVANKENKAPAFMLANRGYDVWLGNFRGNKHSRNHTTYNPNSSDQEEVRKFWDFSFHEMGTLDIPSIFEHIHNVTNRKINYIGHSQGSMAMLVALTNENPIVKKYIQQFIALGPVAYIEHITYIPLQLYTFITKYVSLIDISDKLGFLEISSSALIKKAVSRTCSIFPEFCSSAYSLLSSTGSLLDQSDRFDIVSDHTPSGTSLQNMNHFHQLITSYEFKRFDYGPEKNMIIYGQQNAPMYDLSKIKNIPISLFVGTEDRLSITKDVLRIKSELLNNQDNIYYKEIKACHSSYMHGKDMSYFNEIFDLLQHHDSHNSTLKFQYNQFQQAQI